jgi:H+-transporting ATPase
LFVVATKANFFQRTFGLALSTSEPQQDNQLHMLIYLQVVQISHALIFVVRSERLSVCRRPSAVLLGVFCVAQIISSIIAAYGNWESASVNAVTAGWIGLIWVWVRFYQFKFLNPNSLRTSYGLFHLSLLNSGLVSL